MLLVEIERKRQYKSQAQLAREAGINATSMCRIERGKEPAYPKRGARIAEALGWQGDPMDLFKEVADDGPTAA